MAAANAIDERLRTRVFVPAGPHDVTVTFIAKSEAETHEPLELHTRNLDLQDMNGLPLLDYVNIRGPLTRGLRRDAEPRADLHVPPEKPRPTRSRARPTFCRRSRIAHTGARSRSRYRAVAGFFGDGRKRGTFDAGIEIALRLILTSPSFLFRDEKRSDRRRARHALRGGRRRRSLRASRSSCGAGRPTTSCSRSRRRASCTRRAQPARRWAHARRSAVANALVDNFAAQWLYLRNLKSVHPDVEKFPDYDDNLRTAMRRETESCSST